jgi:AcrR family transcriptional regulator
MTSSEGISMTETAQKVARRDDRSAARRNHLLQTARSLFVERGFRQTSVALIATAADISVGLIYRYFANKEAIIAAICENDMTAWLEEEELERAVRGQDCAAIAAWIERFCTSEPTFENRRMMIEMLAEVGRNPVLSEINDRVNGRVRDRLHAALQAIAPGSSQQCRQVIATLIISLSWGMVAVMELGPGQELEGLRSHMITLVRNQLAQLAGRGEPQSSAPTTAMPRT